MITDILIDPFDIAEVGAVLEAQPHTSRDALRPEMFLIADSDDTR